MSAYRFLALLERPTFTAVAILHCALGRALTESNLSSWARRELELAGLFKKDSDYGGMLGDAVMKLINTFSEEGHSGCSAAMATELFNRLSHWKPLTPLTSNPDEWMMIDEEKLAPSQGKLWQSLRCPSTFSRDGGKTWYDIDDSARNNGDTWDKS